MLASASPSSLSLLLLSFSLPSASFLHPGSSTAPHAVRGLPEASRHPGREYFAFLGSRAEQTAHSACDSHVSCFPPCKLLQGREDAVSLPSHLHLSPSPYSLGGKSVSGFSCFQAHPEAGIQDSRPRALRENLTSPRSYCAAERGKLLSHLHPTWPFCALHA